ncbi:dethiobiotin synthase [soil metagenome]
MGALLLVTGVGTNLGKTHLAEALLGAWSGPGTVVGYKPIESGVSDGAPTDQGRLDAVSTFHVKHPRLELADPVSPHLALRREGKQVDLELFRAHVRHLRGQTELVVVELAGGAFSPVDETRTNADVLALWPGAPTILVAVDRLGVLHDVLATLRALAHEATPIRVDHIVLQSPEAPDASTGTNAAELTRLTQRPVTVISRGTSADPRIREQASQLLRSLV